MKTKKKLLEELHESQDYVQISLFWIKLHQASLRTHIKNSKRIGAELRELQGKKKKRSRKNG